MKLPMVDTFRAAVDRARCHVDEARSAAKDPGYWDALRSERDLVRRAALDLAPALVRTARAPEAAILSGVLRNAARDPHALAVQMDDDTLTWAELAELSGRVATVLERAGVKKGDVVAIIGRNAPLYLALILGASHLGATAALINHHLTDRPLAHALDAAKARVAVVQAPFEAALRSAVGATATFQQILVYDGGAFDRGLAAAPPRKAPPVPVSEADDYVYIYTSGTTGLPKPARVSHGRAMLAGLLFGKLVAPLDQGDKLYCVLPLYHANALLIGFGMCVYTGCPIAIRESFSGTAFWHDVHRYHATAMVYIGELCRYLVAAPDTPESRDNPLRLALGNGLRPDIWKPFAERFGIADVREFYAATEGPGLLFNLSNRVGSVGRLPFKGAHWLRLARYDIDRDELIRDERGHCLECAANEPGELLMRLDLLPASGATEFRGYTDEQATKKKILTDVFRDGDRYFRSGDLLRRDEAGFFYFVDRIGDTFRWKGENVSTAEVADVLATAASVREVTVVGVRVPGMEGAAGLAAVVPAEGGLDLAELFDVSRQLPRYARPRFVRVLGSLDKTSTFKVQKARLRSDGIDPAATNDPLYVLADEGYVKLTKKRRGDLESGRLRL